MSVTNLSGAMTRRDLLKTAAAGGTLLAAPRVMSAPALAQSTRRDLRIGVFGGDFGAFSPVQRLDAQSSLIAYNIFDGLVRLDYENRKILPWIAEDWSQSDPLTWRIKLYTWQYSLDSKSVMAGTSLFALDTMKTDGTYVLEVKTKIPFGAFPGVTMGRAGFIVSEKAHKEIGAQNYGRRPIGQGAFMLESVRRNEVELVCNPDYWRAGFPKLDRLLYRAVPDSNVRLQSLMHGELDFITHPDPKDATEARSNTNLTFRSTPGWNWTCQQFNLRAWPDLPYHDKLVRQAISYAIDREAIVNEIHSGQATVTDNQIPAGFLGHRQQLMRYPKNGDLKKAKELIAQAGVRGYEVEVIVSDKDWLRKELELVAAMVSEIGITYKIRNLDIGGYTNFRYNRRYEQLIQDTNIVAPDPDATAWWFLHSRGSSSSFDSPVMDRLLDDARGEAELPKRAALYSDIVDMTLDECPFIYHCNVNYMQVYDKRLTGYVPNNQEYAQFQDATSWT
jgi:peptide/nickel transport system substrate-binding protein